MQKVQAAESALVVMEMVLYAGVSASDDDLAPVRSTSSHRRHS